MLRVGNQQQEMKYHRETVRCPLAYIFSECKKEMLLFILDVVNVVSERLKCC